MDRKTGDTARMERELLKKTEGFVSAEDTEIKEDSMKNTC